MTPFYAELNAFKRSRIYQSCQIVHVFFIKKMTYVRYKNETDNLERYI